MEGTTVGYRFYPTEEELVSFYLHKKLDENDSDIDRVIPLVDIYAFQPCQLPELSGEVSRGDPEQWFFFVPRQEKEARGEKPSRTTASGYWKATGSPCYVHSSAGKVIGVKKSMVFYSGKAPSGMKSKWKMHEYRAIKQDLPTSTPRLRHELSLCRIYVVSGSFGTFDRRPMAPETSSRRDNMVVKIDEQNDDEFSVSATAILMEEISCSSETSLSEVNKQE